MAEEDSFREVNPFVEIPFEHSQIASALNTIAERVLDLSKVLPNSPRKVRERLWRITLPSEDPDNPIEIVADLDEVERSVGIQIRAGVDRNNYVFEGNFEDIKKVEIRGDFGINFTTGKGTSIYLTPGKVSISEP